jgi:hypothetical protein
MALHVPAYSCIRRLNIVGIEPMIDCGQPLEACCLLPELKGPSMVGTGQILLQNSPRSPTNRRLPQGHHVRYHAFKTRSTICAVGFARC